MPSYTWTESYVRLYNPTGPRQHYCVNFTFPYKIANLAFEIRSIGNNNISTYPYKEETASYYMDKTYRMGIYDEDERYPIRCQISKTKDSTRYTGYDIGTYIGETDSFYTHTRNCGVTLFALEPTDFIEFCMNEMMSGDIVEPMIHIFDPKNALNNTDTYCCPEECSALVC